MSSPDKVHQYHQIANMNIPFRPPRALVSSAHPIQVGFTQIVFPISQVSLFEAHAFRSVVVETVKLYLTISIIVSPGRKSCTISSLKTDLCNKELQLVELRAQRWELADSLRLARAELTQTFALRHKEARIKDADIQK